MIPLRCFTCNAFVGHKWNTFMEQKKGLREYKELLDALEVHRFCCRRMLLTHEDIVEDIAMYSAVCSKMDESNTVFDAYVKHTRTVSCD